MENLLNIFVRSVFIDNMIFAYFLGMCSYLARIKDREDIIRIRYCRCIRIINHRPGKLFAGQLRVESRSFKLVTR